MRAWQEVDDSLTAYAQAQKQRAAAARAAAQDKIALGAARQRYQEGLVDFLNVNAALAQLLRSENDLVQSDVEVASDLVRLYRALGGGGRSRNDPLSLSRTSVSFEIDFSFLVKGKSRNLPSPTRCGTCGSIGRAPPTTRSRSKASI